MLHASWTYVGRIVITLRLMLVMTENKKDDVFFGGKNWGVAIVALSATTIVLIKRLIAVITFNRNGHQS